METSLVNRLQATLLAVATVGLVLLAVWNFQQESHFQQPDDGVWWSEAADGSGLVADKVLPDSPGQRAGIQPHDLLTGAQVLPDPPVQATATPAQPTSTPTQDLLTGVKNRPAGPGQRTPMKAKDLLARASYTPIARVADLERVL